MESNIAPETAVKESIAPSVTTWQRLSPIAIVYFAVSFLRAMVGQFVYIIPPLLLTYNSIKEHPYIGIPLAIGLLCLLIVGAVLSFYFFQYRLHKGSIEIRSGVFKKKHMNLPFERIQNVKIEQPIYYRFAGYACLQLDTAGSSKQEANVAALKLSYAEQLKKEILSFHDDAIDMAEADEALSSQATVPAGEHLLNQRSVKDLVVHGITSNRIWIFLGILAPLYDDMAEYIAQTLLSLGIDLGAAFDLATHTWWEVGLYAFSMAMLVMLLLTVFSVFGSLLAFYGYTLTKRGDRYIRRSGLFTKHEVTMRLSRLQMITHKQDWLDLLLKRVNLRYEQINATLQNLEAGVAVSNKIMVPSVYPHQALELIKDAYPDTQFGKVDYLPISKRFLFRKVAFFITPLFSLIWLILLFSSKYQAALALIPIYGFVNVLVYMRWKRWGWAIDDNYVYIRKGVFGYDQFCFPSYKVQQTQIKQSVLMKRKHLCSVKLVLASGAMDIPFVTEKDGRFIVDKCLHDSESTGKSWM